MSALSVVTIIALEIKHVEGFFPGSRSYRDNNPGNLEEQGTQGKDGPYAKFACYQDGWERLISDVTAKFHKYPNDTLLQCFERYAPESDNNNPRQYAQYIAEALTEKLGQTITIESKLFELLKIQSSV